MTEGVLLRPTAALALIGDSGAFVSVARRFTGSESRGVWGWRIFNPRHRLIAEGTDLQSGADGVGDDGLNMMLTFLDLLIAWVEGEMSEENWRFPDRILVWLDEVRIENVESLRHELHEIDDESVAIGHDGGRLRPPKGTTPYED
jgi:hypothetical protein